MSEGSEPAPGGVLASLARTRCRVCGESALEPFLDLGAQPLANALLSAEDLEKPEPRYPLGVSACRSCGLIQVTNVLPGELLFQHYYYFSSISQAMARHFAELADEVAERFAPEGSLIVEIGSNDGILLRSLLNRPLRILGVDPAINVGEQARANGIPTLTDFFGERVAGEVAAKEGPAAAIIACNVIAHIDDLHDVMRGLDRLLAPDGVLVFEAPYVVDFLDNCEFDTIYHEHLSYFGLRPMMRLLEPYGFEVFEVRRQAVHGGTLRVFGRRRAGGPPHPSVAELLQVEDAAGPSAPGRLETFSRRVASLREQLVSTIGELRGQGKSVVGYTAPAKGNVLLNYCTLGPDRVAYLADATPAKQGMFSPGMHIPIVPPERFRADRPDFALLLAWNHRAEVLAKEAAYRAAGGRFIIPLPEPEIV